MVGGESGEGDTVGRKVGEREGGRDGGRRIIGKVSNDGNLGEWEKK